MEALIAGEQMASRCPVCRTPLLRQQSRSGRKDGGQGKHWDTLEIKVRRKGQGRGHSQGKKGKEAVVSSSSKICA